MEIAGSGSGLASHYAAAGIDNFTLVDIGCSGGIAPCWRLFGPKLRAFGFDPNIEECRRLQAAEPNERVKYVNGFIAGKTGDFFDTLRGGRPHRQRDPWDRLGVVKSMAYRQAKLRGADNRALMQENLWQSTVLADRAAPIHLPEYFAQHHVDDIDFIKIDVDGIDFEIMHSIKDEISRTNVLGVEIEISWNGSDHPADHTFHNTDRFMRSLGFDLFDVTVRKYSMAALPRPYILPHPAESAAGRAIAGDALYLRDLCEPENRPLADRLPAEKFLKLAALFDIFGLPDQAADLFTTYPDKFGGREGLEPMLDHLAAQVALPGQSSPTYREHMRRFEEDDPAFYPIQLEALTHLRKGLFLRDRHRLDEARQELQAATSIDPRNVTAWVWLGEVLLFQGQDAAAKAAFRAAIEIDERAFGAEVGFRATNNVFERMAWRIRSILHQFRGG